MADPVLPAKPWYVPERKVWAGGAAGIIAWGLLAVVGHYFPAIVLPGDAQTLLSTVIGFAIAQYVPPSIRDTIKHVDDTVIEIARVSDGSPASEKAPAMTPAMAAAVSKEVAKGT